jgi:hypothetical protein
MTSHHSRRKDAVRDYESDDTSVEDDFGYFGKSKTGGHHDDWRHDWEEKKPHNGTRHHDDWRDDWKEKKPHNGTRHHDDWRDDWKSKKNETTHRNKKEGKW